MTSLRAFSGPVIRAPCSPVAGSVVNGMHPMVEGGDIREAAGGGRDLSMTGAYTESPIKLGRRRANDPPRDPQED